MGTGCSQARYSIRMSCCVYVEGPHLITDEYISKINPTNHQSTETFHSVLLQTTKKKQKEKSCVITDMFHCHASFDLFAPTHTQ